MLQKLRILPGLFLLAGLLLACGDTTATTQPATSVASATTAAASTTAAQAGADPVKEIAPVTLSGDFSGPLDSIPSLDTNTIYFTASSSKGPGVFQVPTAGGAATTIAAGAPFVKPMGLTLSPDGKQLF